ncbi:MAG: hypothetical protein ACR2Q3_09325 [Woeseiaceae bacterium]
MKSAAAKWIPRIAAGVFLTITLILLGTFLILRTESGTRWLISRVVASIPGTTETENLEGNLWSGVTMGELRYSDEARKLSASNLVIEINWSPLLRRTFMLEELRATAVTFQNLQARETTRQPFELTVNPLPIDIDIVRVRLGKLILLSEDARTEIDRISLDNGQLSGNRVGIRSATAATETFEASVTAVDARLDGDVPVSLVVEWTLVSGEWSGAGTFDGTLAELSFDHSVGGPYPASASGTIYLLNRIDPAVNARVSWQQWQFQDYLLQNGSATVVGTANDYESEFNFTTTLPIDDEALVSGTVLGDTTGLSALDVRAESSSGSIVATGSFGWQPAISADVQLRASNIDPSLLTAELSGSLNAAAGVRLGGSDSLIFSDVSVDGVLNDVALTASGDGSATPAQFRCDDCLINMGNNRIRIDGTGGNERIALALSVNAPSLEQLWPGIAGSLAGNGVVGGTIANPQFSGEFSGQELAFNDWSAADANVLSKDSSADTVSITVAVTDLNNGDNEVGSFAVVGSGAPDNLDVTIDWTVKELVLGATANVLRKDAGMAGTIRRANLSEPNTGTWVLQEPFAFDARNGDVTVADHLWKSEKGELRVDQAARTAGSIRLLADLSQFPLQTANAWLPDTYQLSGTANAGVNLEQVNGTWSGSVNWQQEATVLSVNKPGAQPTAVAFPEVRADAQFVDGGATITAALQVDPGVTSNIDLYVDGFGPDALVEAELRLNGSDWDWVPAVVPSIDDFAGQITATVTASGPRLAPAFSGRLNWQEGSFAVPALNVPLSNIDLTVQGAANGAATLNGSARAGEGELTVAGRFEDMLRPTRTVELSVSGNDAEVINWPD